MKVSVIVPFYNGAATIAKTLESILAQDWEDLEVILVNDGSSQPIQDVLTDYIEDSRVKYFVKENGGVASARNMGIAHAQGDLIAFCDQDDLWMPGKLEKQVALFQEEEVVLSYGWLFVDNNGSRREIKNELDGHCFDKLLLGNFISCCTVVVRKEVLDEVGGFDEDRRLSGCDDWFVWLKLSICGKFAVARDPVAVYVLHDENYSRNEEAMLIASLTCLEKVYDYLDSKEKPLPPNIKRAAAFNVYQHYGRNLFYQRKYKESRDAFFGAWKNRRRAMSSFFMSLLLSITSASVINAIRQTARNVRRR